jgi:hypothetical protein
MALIPAYRNQGQKVVAGWDNEATLRDWTSYMGTDGERFPPPNDRRGDIGAGYTDGVTRRLNSGGTRQSGFPIVRLAFPWLSDGQIKYLYTTMLGGSDSGNVTAAVHTPLSVGAQDVSHFNAVMNLNLNQIPSLTRKRNGYEGFVVELVIVEVL